jgi:hypothetical protein
MNRRAEVVVVALILVVLGGLAAPFVAKVREAQARGDCQNSLRSLALGLQPYKDCYGHFPPGTLDQPGLPPDRRLSWHVDLWGFVIGGEELLLDRRLAWDAGLFLSYSRACADSWSDSSSSEIKAQAGKE